jgi:hypothetical protein
MRAEVTTRWAHKDGNAPAEYEDAWRVNWPRVVVSDGATESSLAGRWARLLTSVFVDAPDSVARSADSFARTAAGTAGQWADELGAYLAGREADGKPLKWYERPGLERGAYATLLVVHVDPAGSWHAAAVGDSCVFQVSAGKLCQAFPVTEPDKFDDAPQLIGSPDTDPEDIAPRVAITAGNLVPGDQLYACTDALAEWFLNADAHGRQPWGILAGLDENSFAGWLAGVRERHEIRNDDVTLVRTDFSEGA